MHHQCNGDEEWRSVSGWDGIYEVSCLGRIRRIAPRQDRGTVRAADRLVRNRSVLKPLPKPRVLKPHVRGDYLSVCFSFGPDKPTWAQVHVEVAKAFLDPRPSQNHTVNHKDGNKLDNRAENLDWKTYSEQQVHARQLLLNVGPYRRLTGDQAREIYTNREVSGREYARRLGISVVTISAIRNGRMYRWALTGLIDAPVGERPAHWSACTRSCNCACHYLVASSG
jgi:DNA-binding transcriptional regulator YiaG